MLSTLTPTCNSVTVTWKAPTDEGNPQFDSYTILVNGRDVHMNKLRKNQRRFTITDLKAATAYNVTVRAHSVIFQNSKSKVVATSPRGIIATVTTVQSADVE